MNETTKINFNNADGSFNRDKWLDFMNTSIQSIPYINTWDGHTVGLVNEHTKVINWSPSYDNTAHNEHLPYVIFDDVYKIWDKTKGWVDSFTTPTQLLKNNDELTENVLYLINPQNWQKGARVCVIYPDRTWRYLGFWEYAQYGLKKYIPFKVQDQLKKLGVL